MFATKFDSAYSSSFTEILIKNSKILWSCLDRSEIRFFLILEMSSLISGAISDNGNGLFDFVILGPPQVKWQLLISSIFDAMNFTAFFGNAGT